MAQADSLMRLPDNRFGASARKLLPRRLRSRAAALRATAAGARRSLVDRGHEVLLPHADREAFRRLRWIGENVASGRIDHVMIASRPAQQTLGEHGIPSSYIPVGWHPRMGTNLGRARDIDVLFLGRTRGERGARLANLRCALMEQGVELVVPPLATTREQRTQLLNRTRVLLNMRGASWNPELARFVLGAGCGALVVSEAISATEPFERGTHFVAADTGDLPSVIARSLSDEESWREITSAAHELVTTHVTMGAVAAHVLHAAGRAPL